AEHDCQWRARHIMLIKQASVTERNVHRLEIIRAHGVAKACLRVVASVRLKLHSEAFKITAQWQLAGKCRRHSARNLSHRFEGLGEKLVPRPISVESEHS